ncbi:nucleotidyltransferase domain-containing protein [Synechococcus sp. CCY9202]|uniref:nucleotidyltransferase family protein n=1 Tax=Synechococcus sp. CCY9202 TaxID=174698 RepID=UPI002B20F467|nr:nucleotidyltransferase domain-containing protein [Synechococcus sp. CCY9202]MEA5422349.1 nucleotidyltransferase domain-containing protein [Synechococcus sp. CCY9202]
MRCALNPGYAGVEVPRDLHQHRGRKQALADDPATKALVLFGSRARGEARPGSDLDLLLLCRGSNSPDALLSGSRWHVLGRIAREGKVLYAA